MRITVLDDPGKKINPVVERYKVFLNDEEVKMCLAADDEKGEVIYAVLRLLLTVLSTVARFIKQRSLSTESDA